MQSNWKQPTLFILSIFIFWFCARCLLPAALPFLLGTGLALAAEPGVRFLSSRIRLPRFLASCLMVTTLFLFLCAGFLLLISALFRGIGSLAKILPDLEVTVREGMNTLMARSLSLAERSPESIRALLCRNIRDIFSGSTQLLDRFTRYGLGLAGSLLSSLPRSVISIGTAVLSAFLISSRLPQICVLLRRWLSRRKLDAIAAILTRLKSTAGLWLLAQLKLSGISCLILTAGFFLLRIPFAPIWALGSAAVDAFPVLGTGTVLVPWSILAMLQGKTGLAIGLLGLYAAAALTRSMLEPRLIGKQLGLDPLVTLVALYTGFKLWGVAGMLFLPLLVMTTTQMLPGK